MGLRVRTCSGLAGAPTVIGSGTTGLPMTDRALGFNADTARRVARLRSDRTQSHPHRIERLSSE